MKRLYVRSEFSVDPDVAWDVFESDEFQQRLTAKTGLQREVLTSSEEGGIHHRRLRFVSGNELPAVASKALGSKHLTYEQVNRRDPAASRLEWTVLLPVLSDRVSVSGATTIKPRPGGGCIREVDGTIEVRMRLVGGQVEKIVVAEFEKSMERAVDIAREMLAERTA